MANKITIAIAEAPDAAELRALSAKTFLDTFASDNKKEDMDKYIAENMSLEQITSELIDRANIFFLAYSNNRLSGYAKVRTAKTPDALKIYSPLELERIYVLKEYIGTGIGAALLQHCINTAVRSGHDVLWLGVWERNHKAVNFYKRWGFERFGSHIFRLGDDHQTDILMKKHLAGQMTTTS